MKNTFAARSWITAAAVATLSATALAGIAEAAPALQAITLKSAPGGQVLASNVASETVNIDVTEYPDFSLEVTSSTQAASVKFGRNGHGRWEYSAPFRFSRATDFVGVSGRVVVTLTPYSGVNGTGTAGGQRWIVLNLYNGSTTAPASAPKPSPTPSPSPSPAASPQVDNDGSDASDNDGTAWGEGPYTYGINAPSSDTVDGVKHSGLRDRAVQHYKALGIRSVRVWQSIVSWSNPAPTWTDPQEAIEKYKAAGLHVLVIISPKDGLQPTSDAQVKNAINTLMKLPAYRKADLWQIGNETDSSHYWSSRSATQYVTKFLKPAYEALHAHGRKVVSAGASWMNATYYKEMVAAGLLKYTDFVGVHVYQDSLKLLESRLDAFRDIVGSKRLIATEWTMRGNTEVVPGSNPTRYRPIASKRTEWARENASIWPIIRENFYAAYAFQTFVNGMLAGCGSIVHPNGSKNEPFYSEFANYPRRD